LSKSNSERTIFYKKAKKILDYLWLRILAESETGELSFRIKNSDIQRKIEQAMTSSIKSYHYVLPTQILAKLVDPGLDCRCVQKKHAGEGSFNARSLCKFVIVPFDRKINNVLGGSPEPYVNKPLRVESVTSDKASDQRNKDDWMALVDVLEWVQNNSDQTENIFLFVLQCIYNKLNIMHIEYSIPERVSHKQVIEAISGFLSESSGGDRIEVLATALFRTIGAILLPVRKKLKK